MYRSLLYYFSSSLDAGLVQQLLKCKCDINAQTFDQRTALHMAVWSGNRQMARCLLDQGCDVNIHDNYGDTPVMLCARRGHPNTALLRMLLRYDKNVNACNGEGDTALIHTARYGRKDSMLVLLRAGADVNAVNMWGLHERPALRLLLQLSGAHRSVGRSRRVAQRDGELRSLHAALLGQARPGGERALPHQPRL
jgi:ankyrin repeat protein